jgi:hypothetical protein
MKYIKIYEEFKPFEKLKTDIEGIFVDLKDLRYEISVEDLSGYFLLELQAPNGVDMRSEKHREIIKECILMYIEYMRIYYREQTRTLFTNYVYYFSGKWPLPRNEHPFHKVRSKDMLLYSEYYDILKKPVIKMDIKIKKM